MVFCNQFQSFYLEVCWSDEIISVFALFFPTKGCSPHIDPNKLSLPQKEGNFLTSSTTISSPRKSELHVFISISERHISKRKEVHKESLTLPYPKGKFVCNITRQRNWVEILGRRLYFLFLFRQFCRIGREWPTSSICFRLKYIGETSVWTSRQNVLSGRLKHSK